MIDHGLGEGDRCPRPGCTGVLLISPEGECTCHISPPCSSCVEAPLECEECHEQPEAN